MYICIYIHICLLSCKCATHNIKLVTCKESRYILRLLLLFYLDCSPLFLFQAIQHGSRRHVILQCPRTSGQASGLTRCSTLDTFLNCVFMVQTDCIAKISPKDGVVREWILLHSLRFLLINLSFDVFIDYYLSSKGYFSYSFRS